jgi:hypothetical protein
MHHRSYIGEIVYRHDSGVDEGRERFHIAVQPSGARTLVAHCEMFNDRLIRDVSYSLDAQWRPEECYVRVTIDEAVTGSALFRFSDRVIECDALTQTEGRISQRLPVPERVPSFGAHPVCCDTWHSKIGDLRRGTRRTVMLRNLGMSSALPNGGSGPIASLCDVEVEYVGEQDVTTPAGSFSTRHFRNRGIFPSGPRPPVEIWAATEDFIPVRAHWDLLAQTYELVSLRVEEGKPVESGYGTTLERMNGFMESR